MPTRDCAKAENHIRRIRYSDVYYIFARVAFIVRAELADADGACFVKNRHQSRVHVFDLWDSSSNDCMRFDLIGLLINSVLGEFCGAFVEQTPQYTTKYNKHVYTI